MAGVELTDRLGVAHRQLGKFGIGADVLKNLPRSCAFRALGACKDYGDAGNVVESKVIVPPSHTSAIAWRRVPAPLSAALVTTTEFGQTGPTCWTTVFEVLPLKAGSPL